MRQRAVYSSQASHHTVTAHGNTAAAAYGSGGRVPTTATAEAAAAEGPTHTRAAFFDIHGTILKSNVVWPFVLQRLRELPLLLRLLWFPYYALKV